MPPCRCDDPEERQRQLGHWPKALVLHRRAIASVATAKQETVSTVKGYLVGKTIEAGSFL